MEENLEREQLQKEIEQIQLILSSQPTFSVIRDDAHIGIEDDESDRDSSDFDTELTSELSRSGLLLPIERDSFGQKEDTATTEDNLLLEVGLGNENGPDLCLELNLAYQQQLQESLNGIQLAIEENKERQFQIKAQMKGLSSKRSICKDNSENKVPNNISLKHSKPYFRFNYSSNKQLFQIPPPNCDTKERKFHGYRNVWEIPSKKWKDREKIALREGIRTDGMKKLLQPLMNKRELFKQKITNIKQDDKEKNDFENKIKEIQNQINFLKTSTSREELLGDLQRDCDWQKICKMDLNGMRSPAECTKQWQFIQHPSINNSNWTKEEDNNLLEIAEKYQYRNWIAIAMELQTSRTTFQCISRYQRHLNKDLSKKNWTEEEDQLLIHIVENFKVGNKIPFNKVAYFMEGHTRRQVFSRWQLSINPGIKHGPWQDEEDQVLLQQVKKYTFGTRIFWSKIAANIPGRTSVQCRNRYVLKYSKKAKGHWNYEEEKKLIELIEKYGQGSWAKISKELNRTPNQILKHYSVMLGKAVEELMDTNNINEINDLGKRLLKVLNRKNKLKLKQIIEKAVQQRINLDHKTNLPQKPKKKKILENKGSKPKSGLDKNIVDVESKLKLILAIKAKQNFPQAVFTASEHEKLFTTLLKDFKINIKGAAESLAKMNKCDNTIAVSTSPASDIPPPNGRPTNFVQSSANFASSSLSSNFIPNMPPNIATMKAFRRLLLNKVNLYQNSVKLDSLNKKRTFGDCKSYQTNHLPIKNTVRDMLQARKNQQLASMIATTSNHLNPITHTSVKEMPKNIENKDITSSITITQDYQITESRFLSLFLWPTFLSSGSYLQSKPFQDKAPVSINKKRKQNSTTTIQEAIPDLAKKLRTD